MTVRYWCVISSIIVYLCEFLLFAVLSMLNKSSIGNESKILQQLWVRHVLVGPLCFSSVLV